MNFFLKRWLSDSDKPVRASSRLQRLNIETLEDRTTPSITIADVADTTPPVQASAQRSISDGYDPQTVLNPQNSEQAITVYSTGAGLQFLVTNIVTGASVTQAAPVATMTDPMINPLPFGVDTRFTNLDSPSIAIDTAGNIYVAYIQRNATYTTSGALVVNKFTIDATSGNINIVPNSQNVLYQWANQDAVYNPVIGVNNLVSSFTDPDTNQTNTNPDVDRGVFVAWNTNATQSGFVGTTLTSAIVMMAVSDDGGASFSTPQFVSNNGFNGATSILPQIYFTQNSLTNNTQGGQLGFSWLSGGQTLTTDVSNLPADPATPLTVQQTFQNAGGLLSSASTPPNGVLTPATTDFVQTVNITAANFTTLADLNVTISLFSQDLSKMSIELIAPNGVNRVRLLNSRQLLDGAGNLFTPQPIQGLPGGGYGGLGEMIYNINGNNYIHPATGLTFDQQAARRINDPANQSPYILSLRPEQGSLSQFNGWTAAQLGGDWTLRIINHRGVDNNSTPPWLDQWDMKFVSEVNTTGFGTDIYSGIGTAATTPTNVGTATTVSPQFGVQGWYSLAVDQTQGDYSPYQGRIYVAYTTGAGNDTNIYLASSNNNGQTWTNAVQVNDDSARDGFSEGTRAQFQPTVTVDSATGTVIVMWYDARWDGSNARAATFMATSVDGGRSFSPNMFVNTTKSAKDAIDRTAVKIEPIPNNLAALTNGFGNGQGLVAFAGKILPVWTGNWNESGANRIMMATVSTANGPRILQGDMGPILDSFLDPTNTETYNNTFAIDGTRQLNAFYVRFDRYVDPTTFTTDQVQLMYMDTAGVQTDISSEVLAVTALDQTHYGATRFLITIVPQSKVGTYSYAIGTTIQDRIRHWGLDRLSNYGFLTGNQMDQNADTIAGDPTLDRFANPNPNGGVPFVLPYTVDSLPLIIPGPRVLSYSPGTFNNGAFTYIDVLFDRDMLATSFTPDQVLQLLTPDGTTITSGFTITANPPDTPSALMNRTFRVTFPPQILSGYYSLQLGSGIMSTHGDKMDSNSNAGLDILTGRVINPEIGGTFQNEINTGNANLTIPKATNASTPSVVTSKITISNSFIIEQLLTTPILLRLDISFADVRNLTAELVAPDGTVIKLFTQVGQFGLTTFANFTNTVFSDFAPPNNLIQNGSAPFTNGPFLAQQQLSVLNHKSAKGDWVLRITNTSTSLAGKLNFWGLSLPQPFLGSGLGEAVSDRTTIGFKVFTSDPAQPISSTTWTPIGPTTYTDQTPGFKWPYNGQDIRSSRGQTAVGIVTVSAVDPADPSGNTVYAGGQYGGLWKTTNFLTTDASGPTWIPLTDNGLANSMHISSIAIIPNNNDPAQQSLIYVGTGDAATLTEGVGFLRSRDGGRTFRLIDSTSNADANTQILPIDSPARDHLFSLNGTYVNKIVVDPVRLTSGEFAVYAALSGSAQTQGLWRSLDSGRTWTRVQGGGDCTDFLLAPNRFDLNASGAPVLRVGDIAYAAFSGANGGVYFSSQITIAGSMMLLTGGNGKPLFSNGSLQITVGNLGTNPNQNPSKILLAGPTASSSSDPLSAALYQGWLYAYVIGGTAPGLYMTKDYGANWTFVQLHGSLDSVRSTTSTNDATQQTYPLMSEVRYSALAIDATDPNVVYLGGINGIIRVDVSAMLDAHAQVYYTNNLGGVGPQDQLASTGGITGGGTFIGGDYFNRLRDPNQPFVTGSSQILTDVNSFVNTGTGAMVSQFIGFYDNTLFRSFATIFDPLTRKTRLIVSTELGLFSAVDAADPNPTQGLFANAKLATGIGTATSVRGMRNGNLALLEGTHTGVQPSELAADLAGLFNAQLKDGNGFPYDDTLQNSLRREWIYTVADSAYLSTPAGILNPEDYNYGDDTWNAAIRKDPYTAYSGYVQTDPQGSGTIYQYRPPGSANRAGGAIVNQAGNSTDVFLVTLPGQAPIGRTNGLFLAGDSATTGQWASGRTAFFAVNPSDPNGVVISAPNGGQVFLTTNQGINWFSIGAGAIFGNSQGTALAFGGRIPDRPSANSFIYNGTAAGNIFVTFTAGGNASSWTDISTGIPAGQSILRIIANPKPGTYDAYAITAKGVFYKADARTNAAWVNLTGNLFSITKPVFGETTVQPILTALTAIQVDWRFTQPVLYVAGNSGVFQSKNQGNNWSLYPAVVGGSSGGNLPNVIISDLNLIYGSLNSSGVPDQSTGRDILIATTYGRGLYSIQLDANSVPPGLGTSGPYVVSATVSTPNPATGETSFTIDFGSATNLAKINPTSLNPSSLKIFAPDGSEMEYTVTDISDLVGGISLQTRYRVDFIGTTSGQYQLLLNTKVMDTAGRFLNQNLNDVNGENPLDNFSKSYAISVNAAPTISTIPNVQGQIGIPKVVSFTIGDDSTPLNDLVLTITTGNFTVVGDANLVLGGSKANRTLTITGSSNGTSIITLTVTDASGRSTSTSFIYSVTPALTLPYSDSFTQANSPTLSENWLVQSGSATNTDNMALSTSDVTIATLATISQIHSRTQATVTMASAGTSSAALIARYSGTGTSTSMYLGGLFLENGELRAEITMQRFGTATLLAKSDIIPFANEYDLVFEVINDSLKLFVNGKLAAFAFSVGIAAGGQTGFRLTNGNRLDNFSASNIQLNSLTWPTTATPTPTDTFTNTATANGPDGIQLTRDWRDRRGNIDIVADRATGRDTGANISIYNIPAAANVGAQIDVTFTGVGQASGIALRYNGTSNNSDQNMYWGGLLATSALKQTAVIYVNVNGTWTLLAGNYVNSLGGTLRFEATGSVLKLFVNNNLILTAYDSSISSGSIGLRLGKNSSADNFSAFSTSTPAVLPFSDAFTGTAQNQLGTSWTQQAGSLVVSGNSVQALAPKANLAVLNGINAADVSVSAVILPQVGDLRSTGLVARYGGSGDTNMYWGALNVFGDEPYTAYSAQIWKNVNGTWSCINFNANPILPSDAVGKTLRFEVMGSSLKLFLNDVLLCFATDTSISTGGTVGIRMGTGAVLANFNADNYAITAPTLPLTDNFNVNVNPRNELSTSWQERSGFYTISPTGVAVGGSVSQPNTAILNGVNVSNVTLSADLFLTGAIQTTQLVARYSGVNGTGDDNFYSGVFTSLENGDALIRIIVKANGETRVLAEATLTGFFPAANFTARNPGLKFSLSGNSLNLYVDGNLYLTTSDSTFSTGSVGIRTNKGAGMDNFSATSP